MSSTPDIECVRILLIDDDEDDFELTRAMVQQSKTLRDDLRWEKTYETGLAALLENRFEICLLDYRLGARNGLELLASARAAGSTTPIIVLTGQGAEDTGDAAMKGGADDYLSKAELTASVLERAIRYALERARHVTALRKSDQRYRLIVETMTEGVWMLDPDAKTTFINARMGTMLGCDPNAMLDRTPLEFLPTSARALFADNLPRLRAGSSGQFEVPFKRADGSIVWTLMETCPFFDESGNYEGALATVMDITARRLADRSLRISEARFRGLWNSALILVTISDLHGRIREMNDAGLRMLGYAREELAGIGLRWSDITPPESQEAQERAASQLGTTGVAQPWESALRRKDGTWLPILASAAMLDDGEGIGIALDLTERKAAEAALRQTEDQLRQAQKMEAVGRLAGGVAHDFNNVLSVILTLSELALADLAPGDALREDLEEIRKAGQRAADLTRQLLMFSRQQVIEPKVLALDEVLGGLEKMLGHVVGEDVDLVMRHAPSLGRVRVDPSSIQQVVMNLVVNARDAMPTGGHLTIETANVVLDEAYARAHHGVHAGPHVMLAVTDSGTGMDKATVARIFEPFFTTKEVGKGTGLGLSTVFGIAQQSRGSVWVYSELGHGTTIKVYLPSVDAVADELPPRVQLTLQRGEETILLVEDEDAVRLAARSILRRNGYTVIEARGAGEAIVLSEQYEGMIHLLLTDVVMPQMSGPLLAKRLAQLRPEMKTLCMSGYTDDSIVRHGVLDGALAFVQKPITPETLTRKVREVLDGAQNGKQPLPLAV